MVSSPSDVSEERKLVETVVQELIHIMGPDHNVHLDVWMHERDARAAVGGDPQEVINQQLGDRYEILIGIFWTRFGTPTPRAGSGSEEEFERAYARYKADPESVSIMVYFKDAPIRPSMFNGTQLKKVQAFRTRIGRQQGVLWKSFDDTETFGGLLRLDLADEVRQWGAVTQQPCVEHVELQP